VLVRLDPQSWRYAKLACIRLPSVIQKEATGLPVYGIGAFVSNSGAERVIAMLSPDFFFHIRWCRLACEEIMNSDANAIALESSCTHP